jgi:hypothetical protein
MRSGGSAARRKHIDATGHNTSGGAGGENDEPLWRDSCTACERDWIGVKGKEMNAKWQKILPAAGLAALLAGALLCARSTGAQESKPDAGAPTDKSKTPEKKDSKADEGPTTKLRIVVTGNGKPVGNASVYVRFSTVGGGLLHKEKQMEVDLKTNEDGTAKVRDLPRGKILVQVVAKGWHTFGQYYEMDSDDKTIEIKLEPPPHWY